MDSGRSSQEELDIWKRLHLQRYPHYSWESKKVKRIDLSYSGFLVYLAFNILDVDLRHSVIAVRHEIYARINMIEPFASLIVALKSIAIDYAQLLIEANTATSLLVILAVERCRHCL